MLQHIKKISHPRSVNRSVVVSVMCFLCFLVFMFIAEDVVDFSCINRFRNSLDVIDFSNFLVTK